MLIQLGDSNMKGDPSLEEEYSECYQKELQMTIQSEQSSLRDEVMMRVFHHKGGYKLEMTSESNISFFYICEISEGELREMGEVPVGGVLGWLQYMLSGELTYTLRLESAEEGRLVVEQNDKYKRYELASMVFELAQEQSVRESLMFRYERMREREAMLDKYW